VCPEAESSGVAPESVDDDDDLPEDKAPLDSISMRGGDSGASRRGPESSRGRLPTRSQSQTAAVRSRSPANPSGSPPPSTGPRGRRRRANSLGARSCAGSIDLEREFDERNADELFHDADLLDRGGSADAEKQQQVKERQTKVVEEFEYCKGVLKEVLEDAPPENLND